MPIIHIKGPDSGANTAMANSLRTGAISSGLGAVLVDEGHDGEARYLLEKIVAGEPLGVEPGVGPAITRPAGTIPWKPDPTIVFVNDQIAMLDEFEAIAPGFTALFGPVRVMVLGAGE